MDGADREPPNKYISTFPNCDCRDDSWFQDIMVFCVLGSCYS
jgi:hypothetical protein